VGIRSPRAEREFGERLYRYRLWSRWPVTIMSMAAFVLVVLKIILGAVTFFHTWYGLDPTKVVLSYDLSTPVVDIILDQMKHIFFTVMFSVGPIWLAAPLTVCWALAFVADFIICASLAQQRRRWWTTHWGGIITAIITVP